MAIYEFARDKIVSLQQVTFAESNMLERQDLQRLLRAHIDVIDQDLLVISEGFKDWEGSKRELDLLAVDRDANLVVIELKRTEDGGHADLQAIRYAAMVSAMTFEKAVEVFAAHRAGQNSGDDAQGALLEFLGWEEADEDRFAQDVRIVLVAANHARFEHLSARRAEIEAVAGELVWDRNEEKKSCVISAEMDGGYRDDPTKWPATQDRMIARMISLDRAIAPYLDELKSLSVGRSNVEVD